MAKLSAEQKQKREWERLLPITTGRRIHTFNYVAVAFFFYDPTADNDGCTICTTKAETEAGAFVADNHGMMNCGGAVAAMEAVAADKEQVLQQQKKTVSYAGVVAIADTVDYNERCVSLR